MLYHERIREIRKKKGESQAMIAELLGTTQQAYSDYERAKNEIPASRIKLLCEHWNVSADYILGITDQLK
ncbi:MAG: helix-turn-helix transcriptional regulator [Clostridia bacterium]|nr:helix-turn-helix transcriptional regulator [Clostridia bacterium]